MTMVAMALGLFLSAILVIAVLVVFTTMLSSAISQEEEDWEFRYYQLMSEDGDERAVDER